MHSSDDYFTPQALVHRLQQLIQTRAEGGQLQRRHESATGSVPARGVRIQELRIVLSRWLADWNIEQQTIPTDTEREVAFSLLREKMFEDQMAGVEFLGETLIPSGKVYSSDIALFSAVFDEGSFAHYLLCDAFSLKILRVLLQKNANEIAPQLWEWFDGRCMWKMRAALMALEVVVQDENYDDLILEGCKRLIQNEDRDGLSAVRRLLQALAKCRPIVVHRFLDSEQILSLIDGTTLKKSAKHLDDSIYEVLKVKRKGLLSGARGSGSANGG